MERKNKDKGVIYLMHVEYDYIIADDIKIPIDSSFMGFQNIPDGWHKLENNGVVMKFAAKPDEYSCFKLIPDAKVFVRITKEESQIHDFRNYKVIESAMSGHFRPSNVILLNWPKS